MLQKSLGVTFAQDDKARAAAWTVLDLVITTRRCSSKRGGCEAQA